MTEFEDIDSMYSQVLERQRFDVSKLDYSVLEASKDVLKKLAEVGNSGVSVFDLHQKKHVFTSYSFEHLFGYDLDVLAQDDIAYFNSKIHPEDLLHLRLHGMSMLDFIISEPREVKPDYKLINEYRMQDASGNYIRVIEQHQVLELDADGNVWLSLSILDLSPDQENYKGVKSQLFNFRTGQLIPIAVNKNPNSINLTRKELEVLTLVKDGLLSKEISHRLSISVHTVNTHRQRILEKLDADNSMEAVKKASALGLINNTI